MFIKLTESVPLAHEHQQEPVTMHPLDILLESILMCFITRIKNF
jgi:hypothetical protein